jgi:hypothetical protein
MKEIAFGECPICGQGELLAVKAVTSGKLSLICDDCESQFASPADAQSHGNALKQEEVKVVPASLEEIKAAGW